MYLFREKQFKNMNLYILTMKDYVKRAIIQGNPWINHVKKMAAQKGISYRDALRHPDTKSSESARQASKVSS